MSDPYKLLGVAYTATDAEVKKAYYALARRYHPDNFASDPARGELANRKMREINAAYERILADRAGGGTATPSPATPPPAARPSPPPQYEAADSRRGGESASQAFCGYPRVREMLRLGMHAPAYGELCRLPDEERTAEWHYLAGLAHYGMHHIHDAVREINLACRADRKNKDYRKARDELRHRTGAFSPTPRPPRKGKEKKPKQRGLLSRLFLRLLGMDDGKF